MILIKQLVTGIYGELENKEIVEWLLIQNQENNFKMLFLDENYIKTTYPWWQRQKEKGYDGSYQNGGLNVKMKLRGKVQRN